MSDPTISNYSYGSASSPIGNIFYGQTPSINTVSSSKYTKEQSDLLKKLIAQMGGYASGEKLPTYTGELTAPMTSTQNASIASLLNLTNPNSGLNPTISASLQDIISGKTGLPAAMTENYKKNIEEPMIKNYKETIIPELAGTMASKGLSYGSTKYNAVNDASTTLADALAKGRAQLSSDITKTTLDSQISGINAENAQSQTTLAEILGLGSLGKTEQETKQAEDTALYEQWLRNQPGSNPAMQMIMQILGLYPEYQTQIAGGMGTGGDSGAGGSVLGGLIEAIL